MQGFLIPLWWNRGFPTRAASETFGPSSDPGGAACRLSDKLPAWALVCRD